MKKKKLISQQTFDGCKLCGQRIRRKPGALRQHLLRFHPREAEHLSQTIMLLASLKQCAEIAKRDIEDRYGVKLPDFIL